MIKLHSVSVVYASGVRALSTVSATIDRGEFVFIVGPTGSGKTTLLRLLYREVSPTYGEVWVDGDCLNGMRKSMIPMLRRKVGVVFQDFKLLPDRTVFQNVAYALEVTGVPSREIRKRVPKALNHVGLGHKGECYPEELSGGEQQRTAIARAMVNRPLLLLADEPTGNLDHETSQEIMGLLSDLNINGTTVLVATHNRSIVNSMKKRVILLSGGVLVEDKQKGVYSLGMENGMVLSS